jgi:Tfp pilus assembly protein PilP
MRTLTLLLVMLAAAAPIRALALGTAQAAAAADVAQTAAPVPQTPADSGPTPPPNYSYASDGRRDPFVSLVSRGDSRGTPAPKARPDGVEGILVDEVVVRGIVQSRGGWVAMIAAPNGRSYSIRPGDRLMDGNVHAITGQAVVLMKEVNDPLSLEKQREVRKYLRGEVK